MQPPPDRTNKNPYAMPSAWPRAPQQTFHLQVPKPPARPAQAAAPARPAPPRVAKAPGASILTGSALPPGYTSPAPPPEDIDLAFEPVEAVPDVAPAPPFVAPPETPFAAPLPAAKSRRESRLPLFIGAAVAAAAGLAAAAWLLMREPETETIVEPAATPAPAARAPVIVPPSLDYIMTEEEAAGELAEDAAPAPVTRIAPSQSAPELPSGPVPYSGSATPAAPTPAPAPPVLVQPRPVPPPPASAPGPTPPVADPDAPQTTRDPTSGT